MKLISIYTEERVYLGTWIHQEYLSNLFLSRVIIALLIMSIVSWFVACI